jgi:hypothetical protein
LEEHPVRGAELHPGSGFQVDQKVAQLPGEGIAGPADHQGRRAECHRDGAALLLAGPALDANYESVKRQIFGGATGLIVWLRIRAVPKPASARARTYPLLLAKNDPGILI